MSRIYREPRISRAATVIALLCIGIGVGATITRLYVTFKTRPAAPPTVYYHCADCHKRPLLNTIAKYKKFHRTPKSQQDAFLAELEAAR